MRPGSDRLSSLNSDTVSEMAEMFLLMGDPTRLRIILSCLPAPSSFGEIARRPDVASSLVSHHLRLLRAARVMRGRRQGKQIHYGVADDRISRFLIDMLDHAVEPAVHAVP